MAAQGSPASIAGPLASPDSVRIVAEPPRHLQLPTCPVQKLGCISKSEIRFVLLVSAALCLLTSFPYEVGRLTVIPGKVFSGVLVHSLDFNNYFAYANRSANGEVLFRNPMTAEPHRPVFFNLEWLATGRVASVLHVQLATALDFLRLICLPLMCFAIYWLSSFLLRSAQVRKLSLVWIATSGGMGWIAAVHLLHLPFNSSSFLDLTNPNLFPFYWMLKLPHFLFSECLVLLGFCCFLRGERDLKTRDFLLAGTFYIAAGTCRPYDMLFAMAVTAAHVAITRWNSPGACSAFWVRLVPVLMCAPLLAYFGWIFKIHPVFKWWSVAGNAAPAPWLLMIAYGLSFLLCVLGIWSSWKSRLTGPQQFVSCALALAIVLAYSYRLFHFSFQFATNILVPMALVGFAGLEEPVLRWVVRRSLHKTVVTALLILNSLTSISLTAQATLLAHKGDFHQDSALLGAFAWLDSHSQRNDVVFADFDISSQVPQHTNDIVFCGYVNTVRLNEKLRLQDEFLDRRATDEFRLQFLRNNNVRFVMLSALENRNLEFGKIKFLVPRLSNASAAIFSVQLPEASGPPAESQP
jgi:hypothetical protein